jgi:glycosyltransferase involved in cell wall biosynthesis
LWLELVAHVAPAVADLDPHFVWIGGPPPGDVAAWKASSGLGDRVTFTGSVDNPYPWLAALDVFTLTSRQDQFPLVVLEAMHLGRPVVAFAVGDVAAQIDGAGRLVPPLSTAAAAEAVIALLRDPDARSRLGQAARTRAREHFPMAGFASSVEALATDSFNRGCAPDHQVQLSSGDRP